MIFDCVQLHNKHHLQFVFTKWGYKKLNQNISKIHKPIKQQEIKLPHEKLNRHYNYPALIHNRFGFS